ncbi:MAG: class I SAM-dependent methyltransferase [Candidatus Saccharimonadales bacterium]
MLKGPANSYFDGESSNVFREDYEPSIRGHVRYELTHRNLAPYLRNESSLEIADIGGGSGNDSVWLAQQGHNVTLIEPAADQITKAEERASALPDRIANRITIIRGTTETALQNGWDFDVVMSHGVAMYLQDYTGFIGQLGALTRPGGHISILEKNYYAKEASLLKTGDETTLTKFYKTGWVDKNNTGKPAYAFKLEQLERLLSEEAGSKVLEWFGVRIISHEMNQRIDELSPLLLKLIIDAEVGASEDIRRRGNGQMLHFIAKKV